MAEALFTPDGDVRQIKSHVERRCIAWRGRRNVKQQCVAEDAILAVTHGAIAACVVGWLRQHLVAERIVKEELRGKFVPLLSVRRRAHLEVDMDCTAGIPAGVDGREGGRPIRIRNLVAAQPLLALGIKAAVGNAGIDASASQCQTSTSAPASGAHIVTDLRHVKGEQDGAPSFTAPVSGSERMSDRFNMRSTK